MKTPIHPDTRLDGFALDQFEKMLASKPWAIYVARVQAEAVRLARRCVSEANEIDLRRAQGAAAAVEDLLTLPGRIHDELRRGAAQRARKAE